MTEYFNNGIIQLYLADAMSLPIPDNSVDCVVTSPPYWGLRDYGTATWEGGDESCDHSGIPHRTQTGFNERWSGKEFASNKQGSLREPYKGSCGKCGAVRKDQQLGLEETPEDYCATMVAVFREVWRVLKPTGTVWLNLGDSYASQPAGNKDSSFSDKQVSNLGSHVRRNVSTMASGLKAKDLVGIPWRVAFALQDDGWYLRSDIIWSKPNPMPESVTDRPTKAHEYVFLLTKSPRYYYDADAIREKAEYGRKMNPLSDLKSGIENGDGHRSGLDSGSQTYWDPSYGRNKRTVWEIPTQPYPEAHFATYPEKLVEPCILAGTSEKGVCSECGKPWERLVEASGGTIGKAWHDHTNDLARGMRDYSGGKATDGTYKREHIGWQPTCECNADTVPATVLDPFAGSGTTMAVAQRLGRKGIGTDISKEYLQLAEKRICDIPLPMIL